jgi:hypothetical protein
MHPNIKLNPFTRHAILMLISSPWILIIRGRLGHAGSLVGRMHRTDPAAAAVAVSTSSAITSDIPVMDIIVVQPMPRILVVLRRALSTRPCIHKPQNLPRKPAVHEKEPERDEGNDQDGEGRRCSC